MSRRPSSATGAASERRRAPRHPLRATADVSCRWNRRYPGAEAVDLSTSGVLLVWPEPVGLRPGDVVLVSLAVGDDRVHLSGRVARVSRGADFRTYAAVHFRLTGSDRNDLARLVDLVQPHV